MPWSASGCRGASGYSLHRVAAVLYPEAPAGAAAASSSQPRLALEPPLRRYAAVLPHHLSSDNCLEEGPRYEQGGGRQELAAFTARLGCNGWQWSLTAVAAWRLKVAKAWASRPELLRTHGAARLLRDLQAPSEEIWVRGGPQRRSRPAQMLPAGCLLLLLTRGSAQQR